MKFISTLILGSTLILSSCTERKSEDFFAGKTDHVYYIDLEPEKTFPLAGKKDSIDINLDSKYEFFFETLIVAGKTGFFTLPAIRATEDFNIAISGNDNMPAALNEGDIINNSANWYSTESIKALYYYKYAGPENSEVIG